MTLERMMETTVTVAHGTIVRSATGEITLSYGAGEQVRCVVGSSKDKPSAEEHARGAAAALVSYFPPSSDLRTSPPDRVTVDGVHYELAAVERVERAGKLRALKARLEEME